MATNFVQDGNVIEVVNGNADVISSGEPIVIGDIVGVAITDIPVGDAGAAMVSGVFLLPKLAADVIPMGKKVALKDGKIQLDATDAVAAGIAWEAADKNSAMIEVKLNG
ncbi:DUF2190 family protein [Hafnia paralvei]|uniref:DUF2190 family protein n=1 Tax=Hafnia paralvei TaxID=546367 RepID=UPI001C03B7CD|nr:capsid cement protein [Hafnia paralvei]MBU2671791.1 DUF2190 family protein [Hafnia paralvei]